jgi:hypothetical protein
MQRRLIWKGVEEWRAEAAAIELEPDRLAATGTQIGDDPRPYRIDYRLETGEGFVTRRLEVESSGGERLALERSPDAAWTANGEPLEGLSDALDCDLGYSPLTNAMPILRHALHRGAGSYEFTMAWVSVPELAVEVSRQRYTHLGAGVVRFEALDGEFAGFTAELELDDDGLVLRYPELAVRA